MNCSMRAQDHPIINHAAIDGKNDEGKTPLDLAFGNKHVKSASLLLVKNVVTTACWNIQESKIPKNGPNKGSKSQ